MLNIKTLIAASALTITHSAKAEQKDESEPALGYTLEVNGKKSRVKIGKEFKLNGVFRNPSLKIIPDKYRSFNKRGIQFKYPANFSFESDLGDPSVSIWTLSGNDFVIMVQCYGAAKLTAKEMAKYLIAEYGNGVITPIKYKFGGVQYNGHRVTSKIATATIQQDIFSIGTANKNSLLILQDSPSAEKVSEVESKFTLKLLSETFKLKKEVL